MNNELLEVLKEMTDTELNNLLEAVSAERKDREKKRAATVFEHFMTAFRECIDAGVKIRYAEEVDDDPFTLYEDGFYYTINS